MPPHSNATCVVSGCCIVGEGAGVQRHACHAELHAQPHRRGTRAIFLAERNAIALHTPAAMNALDYTLLYSANSNLGAGGFQGSAADECTTAVDTFFIPACWHTSPRSHVLYCCAMRMSCYTGWRTHGYCPACTAEIWLFRRRRTAVRTQRERVSRIALISRGPPIFDGVHPLPPLYPPLSFSRLMIVNRA